MPMPHAHLDHQKYLDSHNAVITEGSMHTTTVIAPGMLQAVEYFIKAAYKGITMKTTRMHQ